MANKYAFGYPAVAAGGVSTTSGSNSVVGAATQFTVEFALGDPVRINGTWYAISAIADDTHMTLWTAAVDTNAAITYYKVAPNYLHDLGVTDPKGSFSFYSKPINLVNGLVRGAGWKGAEWHWGFLTQTQRNILRTYVTGASTEVPLYRTRTYENNDQYQWFTGVSIWPLKEDRQTTRRLELSIVFQRLVQVSQY